jgi:SlyX protein
MRAAGLPIRPPRSGLPVLIAGPGGPALITVFNHPVSDSKRRRRLHLSSAQEVFRMSEERIIELETRLAYQEQALETLSTEIVRQQKQIEALERSVRHLLQRAAAADAGGGPG